MPEIYVAGQTQNLKGMSKARRFAVSQKLGSVHKLPGHSHNPLAAFMYMPDIIRLETQEPEEKIVLFLRKHPITNIPWILVAIILFFAPIILSQFPIIAFLPDRFQMAATLFWYLIVAAFVLEEALSWFFNVYILTDERIIDVDFYNLIYREVSDAKIDKIQDVTYKVGGVSGTIFHYGDVLIQTAGTLPNFDFSSVPNPAEVARVLQGLRTEEEIEALEGRAR